MCNASSHVKSTGAYAPATASIGLPNETCVAIGNGWGHGIPTPSATTFSVDGGPVALTINFTSGTATTDVFVFVEDGIYTGTSWGVNLSGPTRNATVNGPYGHVVMFVASPGTYNATILVGPDAEFPGGSAYHASCPGPGAYCVFYLYFLAIGDVTFHEVGLPIGTNWSVRIGSLYFNYSTTDTIGFRVTAGLYFPFDVPPSGPFRPSPARGTFNETGAPIALQVAFEQAYPVTFSETGLPGSIFPLRWSVTLNGTTNSSVVGPFGSSMPIGFEEPNGTAYLFTVGAVSGYAPSPSSGTLSVSGGPVSKSIVFTVVRAPLGVRAWANVTGRGGGEGYCDPSTGTYGVHPAWQNVSFSVVAWNGTPPYTYTWTFGDRSAAATTPRTNHTYTEYGAWQANLSVVDASGDTNGTHWWIEFPAPNVTVRNCATTTPTVLGLPPAEGYALIGALVVVAAAVAVVVWRRRMGGTEPRSR